ncbi:hypothetical protein EV196_101154 [Mariniflexile fucanivorans]|uniref:Uncharacterized protein n=1 Tax=Mariniflexile fucanivorans TaxID=264023 RepID=A0A4R1RQR3_9FLAO|nr:outer membrane beta-barrel protein [Mariniflexile fucanivorans]TCL68735.1 hypothetical protein EV196_101154 [Mariniflexile fucanivorans]
MALVILSTTLSYAQTNSELWKFQLAVGINNPIESVENVGYYSKYLNFPTVAIGVQHMFSNSLGAKLDVGFNRSSNADTSLEFKLNYTRVNAQIVYNLKPVLRFLPDRIALVAHAGPGISFTQPLGGFSENKNTFGNALGGMELHYGLSNSLSIYSDLGYAYSLTSKNKYDGNIDGFSFNGDLMYLTFGISVSLNGCRYCN